MLGENPYRPPKEVTPLVARRSDEPIIGKIGWAWVIGTGLVAGVIGIVGRLVRPLLTGPVHYEALACLALITLVCVVLLVRFRRFPRLQGISFYITGTVVVWTAHCCGWLITNGEIWNDVIWLNLTCSAVATLVGCVILLLPRSGKRHH